MFYQQNVAERLHVHTTVELIYLVERCIEEMLLSLSRAHNESWIGHIGVYLLDDEVLKFIHSSV